MTDQQIEERLKDAFVHATPDVLERINSQIKEQKGPVIVMSEVKKKKGFNKLAAVAFAAVLALAVGVGGYIYSTNYAVAATVALEVNPSVEICVNKKERVLEVVPLNDDGRVIVGNMDFSGSSLDVTVNALIGSMLQNGYLNDLANSILISVEDDNAAQGALLQEKLTQNVNEMLNSQAFSGAVLIQTLSDDAQVKQLAADNNISVGKAQLIEQIIAQQPQKNFSELAKLSINDLNLILTSTAQSQEQNPAQSQSVASLGTASAKAYIGEAKAKEIALQHAQVAEKDIFNYEWELDGDNGIMVYEIEFNVSDYEYDYEINATSGAIIKNAKERDNDSNLLNSAAGADLISADEAKAIALKNAGVSESDLTGYSIDLDNEYGVMQYEIEFKSGGYEYDYEINAATGEILQKQKERDDDYYPANSSTPANTNTAANSTNTNSAGTNNSGNYISAEEAKSIALKHAGVNEANANWYKAELDRDDGIVHYEIDFKADGYEYDYEINATSGEIIKSEKEWDDDYQAAANTAGGNYISADEAKSIVLNHAGVNAADANRYESELDYDDGRAKYEIEFKSGGYEYEYELNASTGEILKSEKERDN